MSGDHVVSKTTANFCLTHYVDHEASLVWKIRGFTTQCPRENGDYLKSSTFLVPNEDIEWFMCLYPKGQSGAEGYISVFLYSNSQEDMFVSCEFSLVDSSGMKAKSKSISMVVKGTRGVGFDKFLSRREMMERKSELLPSDELTLRCEVVKRIEKTSRRLTGLEEDRENSTDPVQSHTLYESVTRYFEEGKLTDVTLKVGKKEVFAHKLVLACRSQVFASMFDHNTLENSTNEVTIKDVEFDVLEEMIRFLYRDELTLPNVAFAMKLLVAADKYDVHLLKRHCVEYLNLNITTKNVFEILVVADARCEDELSGRCMAVIQREMSSVSCLAGWIAKLGQRPEALSVMRKMLGQVPDLEEDFY